MVFSSTFFLCYFLPAFLLLYFASPRKYKNIVLLISSVLFYAWGAPKFIFVLIGTTILDFFLVRLMSGSSSDRKRKILLGISVTMNLGLLVYFKYSNFFIQNVNGVLHKLGVEGDIQWTSVVLPIGISFYTFEAMT
jgi:alginate O-acetyltransferase complex protein AlgI